MKLLIVIIGLMVGLTTFSQLHTKDGQIFYEQIDSLPGMSQSEIYKRSRAWVADAFKDAKEVIQLDSKEDGEIIGKGNFTFYYTMLALPVKSTCFFTIKLSSRDGKHRSQVYNVTAVAESNYQVKMDKLLAKPNTQQNRKIINEINKGVLSMFADLRAALNSAKKEDF